MTIQIDDKYLQNSSLNEEIIRQELALLFLEKGGLTIKQVSDFSQIDSDTIEKLKKDREDVAKPTLLMQHPVAVAVKEAVLEKYPTASVVLYGSRARGEHSKNSDWDFLILVDEDLDQKAKKELRKAIYHIELYRFPDEVISSLIRTRTNWEQLAATGLYKNIEEEGIAI